MKLKAQNCVAVIVDIQEKLMPMIHGHKSLKNNIQTLVNGLKLFDMEFLLYEQYPKGLGYTIKEIKSRLENHIAKEKTSFSCHIKNIDKDTVILFGIETHICVLQTCLELLEDDKRVILVANCCGSRKSIDHDIALKRLIQAGVIPTSYESLLFELCKESTNPLFKQISKLVI